MDSLPKEISNIIYDYQIQLKYSKCLDEINNIEYEIEYICEEYQTSQRDEVSYTWNFEIYLKFHYEKHIFDYSFKSENFYTNKIQLFYNNKISIYYKSFD